MDAKTGLVAQKETLYVSYFSLRGCTVNLQLMTIREFNLQFNANQINLAAKILPSPRKYTNNGEKDPE
jgi:type II secretory pathway component HofQ